MDEREKERFRAKREKGASDMRRTATMGREKKVQVKWQKSRLHCPGHHALEHGVIASDLNCILCGGARTPYMHGCKVCAWDVCDSCWASSSIVKVVCEDDANITTTSVAGRSMGGGGDYRAIWGREEKKVGVPGAGRRARGGAKGTDSAGTTRSGSDRTPCWSHRRTSLVSPCTASASVASTALVRP